VRSYYISPEVAPFKRRLLAAFLHTAIAVAIFVLIDRYISHRQIDPLELAIFAVVFALFKMTQRNAGFDLEVDEVEFRAVRGGSIKQKVSRSRIRYVRELKGNILRRPVLLISECGPLISRFTGSIWVPRSLPEYEQIKTQAFDWLSHPASDSVAD
jgi:hypothetical protein